MSHGRVLLGLFFGIVGAVACGSTIDSLRKESPRASSTQSLVPTPTIPVARGGACSVAAMPPEDVVSRFFSLQKLSAPAPDLGDCWTAEARSKRDFWQAMDAWSRTGGAERLEVVTSSSGPQVAIFEVRAWLANGSDLTWGPGQTRWLVLTVQQDNRWQINELRATPPAS